MKKIGDITINDGKGLFDNEGMCDSLVSDLNILVKCIASGQYIQLCSKVCEMTTKLGNLKTAITGEMESKNQRIEELKRLNDLLMEEKTGLPVEKDGAENGID